MNTGSEADATKSAPEGHDAAMLAKFEESQKAPEAGVAEAPKAERPDHIPEKFWKDGQVDVEALAKSYSELEKAKSKGEDKPQEAAKTADQVTPEEAATASTEQAQTALESVGLDYNAISARFQETGELAAADREALNKAGVPDGMIDAYIQGQQARLSAFEASITDTVGGKEEYTKMAQWAAKGLPAAEVAAFNSVMEKGDVNAAKLAVAGLKSKYEAAMGAEPQLQKGGTLPPSVGDVFRSNAELVKAMQDPRYRSDPAYRNDVIQKLNRSSIM